MTFRKRYTQKTKQPKEERYEHPDQGQPELHVYQEDDGDWVVWINSGIADHDGLCIGYGRSRQQAVQDAVRIAEWIEATLQAPPPRDPTV